MTPEDIRAAGDVLDDVAELSDSMTVEQAVAYREAANELWTKVKQTIGLLDTQLVTVLESPRAFNGMLYEVMQSDGKWRPDHMLVDQEVQRQSLINMETGEFRDPTEAVQAAMETMSDLYRSAQTMPKVGGLKKLGLNKWDVADQEPGKPKLKTTPTVEEEQA